MTAIVSNGERRRQENTAPGRHAGGTSHISARQAQRCGIHSPVVAV